MGTITAQSIVDKAELILQDNTNVRWLAAELLDWLNDGQREAVRLAPEAYVLTESVLLNVGTQQSLEDLPLTGTPLRLIDIPRNTTGRAIRPVDRRVLDVQNPDWHTDVAAAKSLHYTFDSRNPKAFYIYPAANGTTTTVDVVFSASPADVAIITGTITVDDIYAPSLVDYVVYRALSKDAEYASNFELAAAHYTAFERSVIGKAPSDLTVEPTPGTRPQE